MKLLLHCCCAPCSSSCVKNLKSENIQPHLFWFNPNIHPYTEYKSRLDCLCDFSKTQNTIPIIMDEYGLNNFLDEVFSVKNDPKKRCKICYRIRLSKTAKTAVENGFDCFSTSLLISPYQDHETIKLIGQEEAEKNQIEFFYRDFRPYFAESREYSRANHLYMQKYCGCIFSEQERYLKTS